MVDQSDSKSLLPDWVQERMLERDNNVNVGAASKTFGPSDPYGSASYPKVEQCIHECLAINFLRTRSPLTHPSCEYEYARERRGVDSAVKRWEHQSDSICRRVALLVPEAFHREVTKCAARAELNRLHFHQGKQGSRATHMHFFNLRPDVTFPMTDFVFITLHGTTLWLLTTPI